MFLEDPAKLLLLVLKNTKTRKWQKIYKSTTNQTHFAMESCILDFYIFTWVLIFPGPWFFHQVSDFCEYISRGSCKASIVCEHKHRNLKMGQFHRNLRKYTSKLPEYCEFQQYSYLNTHLWETKWQLWVLKLNAGIISELSGARSLQDRPSRLFWAFLSSSTRDEYLAKHQPRNFVRLCLRQCEMNACYRRIIDWNMLHRLWLCKHHRISTPRRFGKTISVCLFVAAIIFACPNVEISIYSTCKSRWIYEIEHLLAETRAYWKFSRRRAPWSKHALLLCTYMVSVTLLLWSRCIFCVCAR